MMEIKSIKDQLDSLAKLLEKGGVSPSNGFDA